MAKLAIMVQAGESESPRAFHALLYAKELTQGGHEVKILFDGAGTRWVGKMENPTYPHGDLYRWVKERGLVAGACQFCSAHFGATGAVQEAGVALLDQAEGHPSLVALVDEGYQVLVL